MQKDDFKIRNGEEKDLDSFFELYWISSLEHVEYSTDLDGLKSKEQCREYILYRQRDHLKNPNYLFLVAEQNEKIIGMITGHVGERDESGIYNIENVGFVDELCVLPGLRKSGIGKRLLDELMKALFKKDVTYIGVGVASKNPAIDFYKSQGFSTEGIWMIHAKNHSIKKGDAENQKEEGFHQYDPYGRGKATLPFTVKVKPVSEMGEYIALHGLVPQNELPENLRYKIPKDEIWIREDVYADPKRREQILQGHEKFELGLMETKGLTYKQAHRRAEIHEKVYKIEEQLEKIEKDLSLIPFVPVKIVDETPEDKTKKKKEEEKKQDE
jgi:ribosomal protein S18 acetylase RimI-like enzyme